MNKLNSSSNCPERNYEHATLPLKFAVKLDLDEGWHRLYVYKLSLLFTKSSYVPLGLAFTVD